MLKVSMAEVARRLGVSKATVSLAVNGKPGVNENTRQTILKYMEELENGTEDRSDDRSRTAPETGSPMLIKVLVLNRAKQVVKDPEFDLWSGVLATFDEEARRHGFIYGLSYLDCGGEEVHKILAECGMPFVAGVILFGTEMEEADVPLLQEIHKPLVLYDYELADGAASSVCIDNHAAVRMAAKRLETAGCRDIRYLATGKSIYNFDARREAFLDFMKKKGQENAPITPLGNTIPEITSQAERFFAENPLPDALILENYQVSLGILNAALKLGIRVPEDVKLVGIDEVPNYFVSDVRLTRIRIPHEERAAMTIRLLIDEIEGRWAGNTKIFAVPRLVEGNSV